MTGIKRIDLILNGKNLSQNPRTIQPKRDNSTTCVVTCMVSCMVTCSEAGKTNLRNFSEKKTTLTKCSIILGIPDPTDERTFPVPAIQEYNISRSEVSFRKCFSENPLRKQKALKWTCFERSFSTSNGSKKISGIILV